MLLATDIKFVKASQRIKSKIAIKNPVEFVIEVFGDIVGRDSWFSFAKEGKLAVVFSEIPDYNDNR